MTPNGRSAANSLITTLDSAIAKGADMAAADLAFGSRSLDGVPDGDRPTFLNEFSLGLGWDGASMVVMGTESADNLVAPEELAWQSLLPVFLATGSRSDLVRAAAAGSQWERTVPDWDAPRRPYHLNPNDLDRVDLRRGQTTWKTLSKVVAGLTPPDSWRTLLAGPVDQPGLGEATYQIERSAASALHAHEGRFPSDERLSFMTTEVIPRLRRTARVLILHGFGVGNREEWQRRDGLIMQAFLGTPEPVRFTWERKVEGSYLEFLQVGDRRVIFSRALNGAIRSSYLEIIHHLAFDETPVWPLWEA